MYGFLASNDQRVGSTMVSPLRVYFPFSSGRTIQPCWHQPPAALPAQNFALELILPSQCPYTGVPPRWGASALAMPKQLPSHLSSGMLISFAHSAAVSLVMLAFESLKCLVVITPRPASSPRPGCLAP